MNDRPAHPAPFRKDHIALMREVLAPYSVTTILDPFAGTGLIHQLRPDYETWGIEIEPEWAGASPFTLQGDSTAAADVLREHFGSAKSFDAICTSPVYGNRMSDHFEARDGSRRHTYRHTLGRPLHEHNAGRYQWQHPMYHSIHKKVWRLVTDLGPSLFLLNIKDHIRAGERQAVTEWHIDLLGGLGWSVVDVHIMHSPGQRHGQNHDVRVPTEVTVEFTRRATP